MSVATLDPPKPKAPPAAAPVEATTSWVTAAQVAEMTNDYPRVEIWYGELKVKMPARPRKGHGEVQSKTTYVLGGYVYPNNLGRLFNESGVLLREEPDVLFGPDVAFYVTGGGEGHDTYFRGGPDLVVEIRSPSNTQRQIDEKIDIYFRYGTRIVWLIDIISGTLTVHRPDAESQVVGGADTLDGGDVLPGFSCKVADLMG